MSETNSEPVSANTETALKSDAELKATSPNVASLEERKIYGTAKTENLRDSGWWRLVLPAFVVILCASLFVVPLAILIALLVNTALTPGSAANQHGIPLLWLWITMIVIELIFAALIARGLLKIFLTQSGNYRA